MYKSLCFRKTDMIIPVATLAAAFLIFFAGFRYVAGGTGDTVVISVSGVEYERLPLDTDADVIIPGERGLNNHLVIKDGTAEITDALCPDKICVHQKSISHDGETIVCLPNKVVIEIEAEERGGVDAVAR